MANCLYLMANMGSNAFCISSTHPSVCVYVCEFIQVFFCLFVFRKLNCSLFYILENIFHYGTPGVIANLIHPNAEQNGVRPLFFFPFY